MTETPDTLLEKLLLPRLDDKARKFWHNARTELAANCSRNRFAALLALASRYSKRRPLGLSGIEQQEVSAALPGLVMDDWNLLELLRVALICQRRDIESEQFAEDFEAQFVYADEGETCALYRALPFLPAGKRFVWRAGEGCRTNMLSVFQAIALDSPYPAKHFDDTAWHQLVMKALFLDLPLWRVVGLDQRRSAELTRMALDYAEERESAGRSLPVGLWLCFGSQDAARLKALAERRWVGADARERKAIIFGLVRADLQTHVQSLAASEADTEVAQAIDDALGGLTQQTHFARLVAGQSES
ncbi:EboA domain-containing protein [Gilvimarinus sp. DA14]|uniref:EboA domain-containing protein n=1 Tax=Gilvimarinus sp. DA14 TaxID=2956798 RepID=UPI0020B8EFA5|nr:EboA domain-containing protein [Gilvimarinus sp. DA14]UTF59757.1 EboA domain-containing protein [Gilvimarinus sp. DA14]